MLKKDLIHSPTFYSEMAADPFSTASFQKCFLSFNLLALAFLMKTKTIRNQVSYFNMKVDKEIFYILSCFLENSVFSMKSGHYVFSYSTFKIVLYLYWFWYLISCYSQDTQKQKHAKWPKLSNQCTGVTWKKNTASWWSWCSLQYIKNSIQGSWWQTWHIHLNIFLTQLIK